MKTAGSEKELLDRYKSAYTNVAFMLDEASRLLHYTWHLRGDVEALEQLLLFRDRRMLQGPLHVLSPLRRQRGPQVSNGHPLNPSEAGARATLTTNAYINASRCSRATVAAIQATLHMPVGESCAAMEIVQSTIFDISSGVCSFNVHRTQANVSTVAHVGVFCEHNECPDRSDMHAYLILPNAPHHVLQNVIPYRHAEMCQCPKNIRHIRRVIILCGDTQKQLSGCFQE